MHLFLVDTIGVTRNELILPKNKIALYLYHYSPIQFHTMLKIWVVILISIYIVISHIVWSHFISSLDSFSYISKLFLIIHHFKIFSFLTFWILVCVRPNIFIRMLSTIYSNSHTSLCLHSDVITYVYMFEVDWIEAKWESYSRRRIVEKYLVKIKMNH